MFSKFTQPKVEFFFNPFQFCFLSVDLFFQLKKRSMSER
ncbi:hypothetical protein LEP1GSC062_4510 [Leptospira alexanderi serovar Manhao 3 str. L 60]|uniref:Uncharacterized protein n=1 Tax=Leptospira alexanderi serovar Manhao 3 str. L 60 TaxID=1049759 RepID=V6IFD0_9LEPT|nr:hypothetical protein LEP1GSC062_4510 [Leptospira alexanderi serovar Manhao 3 str. L 60]